MWGLILTSALAAPASAGLCVGGWGVINPAAHIEVLAPEVGLTVGYGHLQASFVDHLFLTVAGPDHLYGLDVRWRFAAAGEGVRPYLAPGVGAYLGGPLPVVPVARVEGGALWSRSHLWASVGLDAMGSLRAVGVGPRLTVGGSWP